MNHLHTTKEVLEMKRQLQLSPEAVLEERLELGISFQYGDCYYVHPTGNHSFSKNEALDRIKKELIYFERVTRNRIDCMTHAEILEYVSTEYEKEAIADHHTDNIPK